MSQRALADAVNVSRTSIANIESGRHRVQIHVLYKLAAALGVEPHDLLPHVSKSVSIIFPQEFTSELNDSELAAVGRLVKNG